MGFFDFLFARKPKAPKSSVRSCPFSVPYVILDVETTGLSPYRDKIIQLSAIRYDPNGDPIACYDTYLNPGCPIPASASRVNHITDSMVSSAPMAEDIRDAFLSFIGNDLIVGYNILFDLRFLANTFKGAFDFRQYVDVLSIARNLLPLPNYKLETVAAYLGFRPNRSFHNSFSDCEAVAAILHHIKDDLDFWINDFYYTTSQSQHRSDSSSSLQSFSQEQLPEYYIYWSRGEEERIAGNIEAAIQLFDKAREAGCTNPAIYESYAKAYRKIKDYENEILILDDAICRFDGLDVENLKYRRTRAKELLNARQKKETELQEKALKKAQKAAERQRREELKKLIPKQPTGRPVVQYSDDGTVIKEYASVALASKEIGVNPKSIYDAANGRQKHAGGFCWKYIVTEDN